jgi:hypothetical protein
MIREGGVRGFRAGLLILPDLMLILPACASAAGIGRGRQKVLR